jgi:hypothetical protein
VLLESQRGGSSRDKGAGAVVVVGLMLLLLGSAGVFFGRLIKAGVSREREFLADAAAVQFTRNPLGLAGALRKIGGFSGQGGVSSSRAEEASHLFFAQAISTRAQSWFATHPPLAKRLRRLDPAWDGKFEPVGHAGSAASLGEATPDEALAVGAVPDRDVATGRGQGPLLREDALDIVDAAPIAGLSGALRAGCREQENVAGVVLAALIDPRLDVAARQRELLRQQGYAPPTLLEAELDDAPLVPVLELAAPALGRLDQAERTRLWRVIEQLIALDGHVDLRELAAAVLLQRNLCPPTGPARASRPRFSRLEQLSGPLSVLYSALALAMPGDAEARFAAAAGAAGVAGLRLLLTPAPDWPAINAALAQLRKAFPLLKPRVLKGCRTALQPGHRGDPQDEALFGLLAAALDCPADFQPMRG